jgi:heme/copper-type cytochrome/quinol oxidase subunit 2
MVLSPDDWGTLEKIVAIAQANFSITEARDWPMLLTMMKVVGWVVTGVIGLALYIWWDLKNSISKNRTEDTYRCNNCRTDIWTHIDGPLWKAITDCCGFMSVETQEKFKARIKKYTEEAEET